LKRKPKKGQSGKTRPRPRGGQSLPKTKEVPKKSAMEWICTHWILATLCSIAGLVGAWVSIYAIAPRITVRPAGIISEPNALSTQFEIENAGYMDAKLINKECITGKIVENNNSFKNVVMDGNRIQMPVMVPGLDILRAGERSTLPMNRIVGLEGPGFGFVSRDKRGLSHIKYASFRSLELSIILKNLNQLKTRPEALFGTRSRENKIQSSPLPGSVASRFRSPLKPTP
jgi:hypothetical protein